MDNDGVKKEVFGAIIGADDMTFLGRATNVKLEREFKGTNTLTFSLPSKYFDSAKGDYIHNEFADLICNESKIKLYFKNEWFEFFVKKIQEDKKFKAIMYTYTCEDSFIDELSRTGYEIEFDDDLNNSVAEVGNFMEEILDMSIWDYAPEHNIGDFTEYNEQRFYRIPLKQFGGTIYGYPVDLSVERSMFLDEDNEPKDYLQKELENAGKNWYAMSSIEQRVFIDNLITISNVFNSEKRTTEFGDDLARERELFWDNYYRDNGTKLLDEDKRVELTGDYIYVPITDLSMIMGTIYEDAYSAVEEPAIYGEYENGEKYGYALQPSSQNPKDFIQFIFLNDGDIYHIDEAAVLSDNDYHYVIPIEEWSGLLYNRMKGIQSCVYWKQNIPTSDTVKITSKYKIETDGDIAYTINATPASSTIDDFTWYPVYYDGYLDSLGGEEVNQCRKISITDRTEYNKEADMFVTVYNNKSDEFIINKAKKTTLYTDDDVEEMVLGGTSYKTGDTEYRVCSKLKTRQILPTLARNLIDNGTNITDTNGWEIKIQNKNNEKIDGTGSYTSLASINIQSTIITNSLNSMTSTSVTIDDYELDGELIDESVSDYFLEITSPSRENCTDFSLEGTVETDYALNFGFVSQDDVIEKDKVYAIRMKTGDLVITGLTFYWRSNITTEKPVVIVGEEGTKMSGDSFTYYTNDDKGYNIGALNGIKEQYELAFTLYKEMFQIFAEPDVDSAISKANGLYSSYGITASEEISWFYTMLERFPKETDELRDEKIALIDESLSYILFGTNGKSVYAFWEEKNTMQDTGTVVTQVKVNLEGMISIHDRIASHYPWGDFSQIANSNDVKYLKYYFLRHLKQSQLNLINYTRTAIVAEPLTTAIVLEWQQQYINVDRKFVNKTNVDLDKIIIGQGSIALDGNYTVEGIDRGDAYISFEDLYDDWRTIYDVPRHIEDSTSILKSPQYHVKNNNLWKWQKDEAPKDSLYVEDESFLLFKANQTINNPYVAIRIDSDPMEITFDSVERTDYGYDTDDGIQINICNERNKYLDDVYVKLVPILKTTVDEEIWGNESLSYDIGDSSSGGTLDWDWNLSSVPFTWDSSHLKSSNNCWIGTSSALNPVYCSSFITNQDEDHTIPYLLLVGDNDTLAGIVYLSRR